MSRYPGRILSSTAPTVNANSAKGIWTLDEALRYQRAGTWPVPTGNGDPYFGYNTLLLPGQGTNGAQNNTFLDSSTNNFTITRNGNTTQGTFTPFSEAPGYWSNYFDGSGDYLTTSTTSTALAMGSGEFTIEAWIYTADTSFMIACSTTTGGYGLGYNIDSGTQGLWLGRVGTGVDATSGAQLAYNTWNHVAVTRDSGNTVKFWVNGVQSGSNTTVTSNYGTSAQAVRIAADLNASLFNLDGYLSNVRITKGAALYTGAFTPSTAPLTTTVSSGTVSLLTCQSNRFIDNSVNAFALTANGNASVQTFQPFGAPTSVYSAATNGGSGYFDGSGDYLTIPNNSAFLFGTGNFTAECWVYPLSYTPSTADVIVSCYQNGTVGWTIALNGTGFYCASAGDTQLIQSNIVNSLQWFHLAMVRSGTTLAFFVNGTRIGTLTDSTNITSTTELSIGTNTGGGALSLVGYMSGLRIVKGTAVYDPTQSTLTVPTAPPTAIANTNVLLNYTNAGVIDNAISNDLETVGGAQISTTQYKWGASSVYFDGSGDRLLSGPSPNLNLSSGDWTIEAWVYLNSVTGYQYILNLTNATGATSGLVFGFDGNKVYIGNGAVLGTTGTTTLSIGQWYHIAAVRVGSNVKFYVNGLAASSAFSFTPNASQYIYVGSDGAAGNQLNAYVADLRITRGYPRYLYNFTAPTAAFPLFYQAAATPSSDPYFQNTTLLLPGNGTNGAQNNTFLDSSTNAFSITRNGNTTQGTFAPFSKVDGRWGNYFDGSSKITTPSSADFGFGTGDFHISFWAYLVSDANKTFFGNGTDNLNLYVAATTKYIGLYTGSTNDSTTLAPLNEWAFFVVTRTGSNLQVYLNNVSILSISNSTNFSTTSFAIGSNSSTSYINSYISNFKIVKGVAWTPAANPTSPSTADANTKLLTCQSNRFIDNSANAFAFTLTGTPLIQTFSPFPTTSSYDASVNGGSGYFDGTADYLSVARNSAFTPTGDFTYEIWVYPTATPDATNGAWLGGLGESGDGNQFSWTLKILSNLTISFYIRSTNVDQISTETIKLNQWNYIAVTRQGSGSNNLLMVVNGVSKTFTDTGSLVGNGTPQFTIGADTNGDEALLTGYVSGARLLNGTGYTSISVPTAPPTAITNTSFLANFTNGGIIDNTMSNDLETVGGAAISTTQSKFGGSSIYFDGSGDYLQMQSSSQTQNFTFGTGDFTLEMWVYFNSVASGSLFEFRPASTNGAYPLVYFSSSGVLTYYANTAAQINSSSVSTGQWYHFAICRYSSSTKMFINGIQSGSTYADTTNYLCRTGGPLIGVTSGLSGDYLNGYIDDFRITKGIARYVQNFTPPTSAFLTL